MKTSTDADDESMRAPPTKPRSAAKPTPPLTTTITIDGGHPKPRPLPPFGSHCRSTFVTPLPHSTNYNNEKPTARVEPLRSTDPFHELYRSLVAEEEEVLHPFRLLPLMVSIVNANDFPDVLAPPQPQLQPPPPPPPTAHPTVRLVQAAHRHSAQMRSLKRRFNETSRMVASMARQPRRSNAAD